MSNLNIVILTILAVTLGCLGGFTLVTALLGEHIQCPTCEKVFYRWPFLSYHRVKRTDPEKEGYAFLCRRCDRLRREILKEE